MLRMTGKARKKKKVCKTKIKTGYAATEVACEWAGAVINQSPKGNMWSAIPVALLCMIVNLSERKQGSGPEGDEVL